MNGPDKIVLENKYGRWTCSPFVLEVLMDKLLPASSKQLRQYFVHERLGGDVERGQYQDIHEVSSLLLMIADITEVEWVLKMKKEPLSKWEAHWDRLDAEVAERYAAEDAADAKQAAQQAMRGTPHPYQGDTIWECETCGLTDRAWDWVEVVGGPRYWVHSDTPGDPNEYSAKDDHRE